MTPADLRLRGLLLYGRQWQAPLAENLGVTERTIHRLANGLSRIMPRHEAKINELLEKHDRLIRATLRNDQNGKCLESRT